MMLIANNECINNHKKITEIYTYNLKTQAIYEKPAAFIFHDLLSLLASSSVIQLINWAQVVNTFLWRTALIF